MKPKHYSFDSKHLRDFEIEKESWGNVTIFPRTSQLPALHQALDKEFRAPLSQLVSRVNAHSDDFWKIVRRACVFGFCHYINSGRPDKLRLFCLPDPNKVARITIVQQITRYEAKGPIHSFGFYGGEDFFLEIRLSGRKLLFTDHVLQRFQQRADNLIVEELGAFLNILFNSCVVGMKVNRGEALILPQHNEFLAFTYRKDPSEYVITTCLSKEEVYDLKTQLPAKTFNFHYGESFQPPKVRNWNPLADMVRYEAEWRNKKPLEPVGFSYDKEWSEICNNFIHAMRDAGYTGDSKLHFIDDIPGPHTLATKPGQSLLKFDAAYLAGDFFKETCELLAKNPQFLPDRPWHTTKEHIPQIFDYIIDACG